MIDLRTLTDYLRVDPLADDLLLIQHLRDAQMRRIAAWVNRPIFAPGTMPTPAPAGAIEFDETIGAALMILVAEAYDARGAVEGDAELGLPRNAHDLLIGYRRFYEPPVVEAVVVVP